MHTQDLNSKYDIIIPSYKVFDGSLGKGLIAYYGLDDNLGSTYVTDNTKRGYGTASTNTSTLYSASGKVGGCFNFSASAHVHLTNLEPVYGQYINWDKPFSISMWINPAAVTGARTMFTPSVAATGFDLATYLDTVYFDWKSSGQYQAGTTAGVLVVGVWSHIVLTYNGASSFSIASGNVKIYHNTTPTAMSQYINGAQSTSNGGEYALAQPAGGALAYTGLMDQVCVWNRELSQAEITRLYNGGAGLQPIGNSYRISQQSAELITDDYNREFNDTPDWTGANWARDAVNNKWVHTTGATTATQLGDSYFTNLSLCDKVRYLVTFTVSGMTAGTLTPYLEDGEWGTPVSVNGTYSQILISALSAFRLFFAPSSTFDGALDNVSLKALNDVVSAAHDGTIIDNGTDYSGLVYGNAKVMTYLGVLPTASTPIDPPYGTFYYDSDDSVFKIWDYDAYDYIPIAFV